MLWWIGEWDVHRADGVAGVGQHAPNRFCAARRAVQVTQLISSGPRFQKIENAVLARILACHKGSPGWRSDRRED